MSNTQNLELAKRGKEAVARFLYGKGYDIIARDWECAAGTADIIARNSHTVIFVEAMTYGTERDGFPEPKQSNSRRRKWENIALAFMADFDEVDIAVRFDQVAVKVLAPDRAMIRHFIGAYSIA